MCLFFLRFILIVNFTMSMWYVACGMRPAICYTCNKKPNSTRTLGPPHAPSALSFGMWEQSYHFHICLQAAVWVHVCACALNSSTYSACCNNTHTHTYALLHCLISAPSLVFLQLEDLSPLLVAVACRCILFDDFNDLIVSVLVDDFRVFAFKLMRRDVVK